LFKTALDVNDRLVTFARASAQSKRLVHRQTYKHIRTITRSFIAAAWAGENHPMTEAAETPPIPGFNAEYDYAGTGNANRPRQMPNGNGQSIKLQAGLWEERIGTLPICVRMHKWLALEGSLRIAKINSSTNAYAIWGGNPQISPQCDHFLATDPASPI